MRERRAFLPSPRLLIVTAVLTAAFAFFWTQAQPAEAARPPAPVPVPGLWCGINNTGNPVRVSVSLDARFVETITILDDEGGSLASTESGCVLKQAQIKDAKFIFRCGGSNGGAGRRCKKAPCRGDNGGRTVATMMRGTFRNSEFLKGNYSGQFARSVVGRNGRQPQVKLQVGNYIAWPEGSAPCP